MSEYTPADVRQCTKCAEVKPVDDFHRAKRYKHGRQHYCKACNKAYQRQYQRRIAKQTAERYRMQKYGLTLDQVADMREDQGDRCAICRTTEPGGTHNDWVIDHCHETGRVRGLLCSTCNRVLGLIRDNPNTARAMAAYLSAHKESPQE